MEFWKTKQFQALSKIWELKLKDSGFIDAESRYGNIKTREAVSTYGKATPLERETRQEYFRILGKLTNETKFKNELERLVMTLHSEGHTIKDIVERLHIARDRKTIRYIIRRWQMKWGIRTWTLGQMNLKKVATK